MNIRSFSPTETEYQAIATVEKAVWPDNFDTAADFKRQDDTRDPQHFFRRLVVEQNGRILAFAHYRRMHWTPQPGCYALSVNVHPEHQQLGIGTAVYDHILAALQTCNPLPRELFAYTRSDKPHAVHFLKKRGFAVVMRWIVSVLDLTNYEFRNFDELDGKLQAQGLQVRALSELAQIDPDWAEKVYELDWACTQDEPQPVPAQKPTFTQYKKQYFEDPNLPQESWFVAVDDGRYVGMTQFYRGNDPLTLKSGFTGVLRAYRCRGVATWLKLHAITHARQKGVRKIRTGNEENNPMYSLNQKLGFVDLTVTLSMHKEL